MVVLVSYPPFRNYIPKSKTTVVRRKRESPTGGNTLLLLDSLVLEDWIR